MVKREAVKDEKERAAMVKHKEKKKEKNELGKQEKVKVEEKEGEDDDCVLLSVSATSSDHQNPSSSRASQPLQSVNVPTKGKGKAKQNMVKMKAKEEPKKRSSSNTQPKKGVKVEKKVKSPSKASSEAKKEIKEEGSDEKRDAIFRKAPSRKVMERVERVNCQRMFLLHREQEDSSHNSNTGSSSNTVASSVVREDFKVLGSTGNVYTVTIDRQPRCDCPDWRKNGGDPCKHTIFVFLRVLGISQTSHTWYQKALLSSELQIIFASARPDPTTSNPSLQSAYKKAVSGEKSEEADSPKKGEKCKIPQKGDVCPICYEEFAEGIVKGLVFCTLSCGNPLHSKCASEWSKSCKRSSQEITCIYCRALMKDKKDHLSFSQTGEYMNLAGPSSLVDRRRDFSVYSWSSLLALRRRGTLTESEYQNYLDGYASGGNESNEDDFI